MNTIRTILLTMAAVMAAGLLSAQEVAEKRDTVRDTVVIKEVVVRYVLTGDSAKVARQIEEDMKRSGNVGMENGEMRADVAKKEKKKQPIKIHFDFRGDWLSTFDARPASERALDSADAYKSAFTGKYVQFYLDGNITDGLSYHYRQRLNRLNSFDALLKSIDKAYMRYDFKSGWNVSAGKFPLAIGGWEYDAAPIDVYFSTEFWNQVYCFQLGIRGGYNFKDGKNSLIAEVANSPFNTVEKGMFNNMYSYSLLWYGDYKVFQSAYSVNVFEVKDGTYMGQVVLGNRFIAGPMTIELDWTNRFHGDKKMFEDFTADLQVKGNILGWANAFVKVGYDQNCTNYFEGMSEDEPYWIKYGSKLLTYGAGVEVYPIKKERFFRLHAYWYQRMDIGAEDWKEYDLKQHQLSIGMTVDFTAFERK